LHRQLHAGAAALSLVCTKDTHAADVQQLLASHALQGQTSNHKILNKHQRVEPHAPPLQNKYQLLQAFFTQQNVNRQADVCMPCQYMPPAQVTNNNTTSVLLPFHWQAAHCPLAIHNLLG
jgi:hypothetical protein